MPPFKLGTPVTIELVGNGFIVRPSYGPREVYAVTEVLVFNDLGMACSVRDDPNVPNMLQFLQAHFSAVPESPAT